MSNDFERLDAILGAASVGILAVSRDGHVQLQNAEASRILGVSAESALGRPLVDVYGQAHPVAATAAEASAAERPVAAHGVSLAPPLGDAPRVVDLVAAPFGLAAEPGQPADGIVVTLHDRTIGHELEALVDERTRAEVFGQLAAGLTHELGNPLSGIRGAAELLLDRLEAPDLRRYPELIRAEADRMRRLLRDLDELTRGAELVLRATNIHRLLDDLLELHSQSVGWRGIAVVREYDPSIPELELDPDRITQVLLNLVRNAVQAMGEKGCLTLSTRIENAYHMSRDAAHARSAAAPVPHLLRVDVSDTGRGIPAEDLPGIFAPFFTRRAGGTGLGLAVAQHWIVRHGGSIQASSEPGRGTRMRVLLPLRPARSAA